MLSWIHSSIGHAPKLSKLKLKGKGEVTPKPSIGIVQSRINIANEGWIILKGAIISMLNSEVKKILDTYYNADNKDTVLKKYSESLYLNGDILKFCKVNNIEIKPMRSEIYPSEQWYFKLGCYRNNDFDVSYISILTVSKLANIYRLEHNFEVVNKDPKKLSPILDGTSEEGHNFLQADLEHILNNCYEQDGYSRMFDPEATRKVEGVNFSEDVILFGPDVTQEDVLFNDVLDILPD